MTIISLHFWRIWPTVWRPCRRAVACQAWHAVATSAALNDYKKTEIRHSDSDPLFFITFSS